MATKPAKSHSILDMVKWYIKNLPIISTILLVVLIICYKIKVDRHIADPAICVQPHAIMSGQSTRLIKYVIHHKSWKTLTISLGLLATYGSVAERQMGSLRYLYNLTIFSIISAALTVTFSIILGFSGEYSYIMYSCPSYGLSPALLGVSVMVYRNIPMKKVFCLVAIPTFLVPWILVAIFQITVNDSPFLGNICGCITGTLYIYGLNKWLGLCSRVTIHGDTLFTKLFKYLPIPKYFPGSAPSLPVYVQESSHTNGHIPTTDNLADTPTNEEGISLYKVNKLQQMGFTEEESIVALKAGRNDVNKAAEILTNKSTSITMN